MFTVSRLTVPIQGACTGSIAKNGTLKLSNIRSYSNGPKSFLGYASRHIPTKTCVFQSSRISVYNAHNALLTRNSNLLINSVARFNSTSSKDNKEKPTILTNVKGSTPAATPAPAPVLAPTPAPAEEKKMTIWEKVKHEVNHYWDGTKLLGFEIKVSSKLALKMAAGYELTRRERRQLKRTIEDIIRLVPFSMFIIVPFAELLLPIALKIFPNMLPSTYESGADKEKKLKKLRKTRHTVGEFLKGTVQGSGLNLASVTTPAEKEQFMEFFKQVKSTGGDPTKEEILKIARMFKDDVVLDNLSRPQLVAMARYMNMQPFGTNVMLRYIIRHKMMQIKTDDRAIDYEGVDSLNVTELQNACAARGITTYGVSPARLREDLSSWIELRLKQKVPSSLLILSSAYNYASKDSNLESYFEGLKSVLSALPEELYHEAELEVADASGSATNKQRLEVLKEQQELIQEEIQEEKDSGHIIQVKDELNLDEEPVPVKKDVPEVMSATVTEVSVPDTKKEPKSVIKKD